MRSIVFGLILCIFVPSAATASLSCPDAELFSGKLITHINWATAFSPMRIGGAFVGDENNAPAERAASTPGCICFDENGVPEIGTQMSYWEPTRLIEVVRNAFCSPAMGGQTIMNDNSDDGSGHLTYRSVGGLSVQSDGEDKEADQPSFYYYNYWAFPVMVMLEMFVDNRCSNDGWQDMDLMYVSGLDPTYESDLLSVQLTPEVSLVSRPEMQALCATDAVSSNIGKPIQSLWWCAGSWGSMYTFTGHGGYHGSPIKDSSLIATRGVAAQHRRGLARLTMGNDAMCSGKLYPVIPKTQYLMSMFYPVAEVGGDLSSLGIHVNGFHHIGESTFKWGEWRNIPAVGEDFLYILWRWNDCCLR